MSKKKTKKSKYRKPEPQDKSLQTLQPSEKKRMTSEVLFFSLITFMLLIAVFNRYLNDINTPEFFRVAWSALVVFLLMVRAGLNRIMLKSMMNHKDYADLPIPRKIQDVMRIVSIIIIALIIFPAFYLSPFREQVSAFLISLRLFTKNIVESLYNILSIVLASISGYIGNIVLGALGNLLYDFIKLLFKNSSLRKVKGNNFYNKNTKK